MLLAWALLSLVEQAFAFESGFGCRNLAENRSIPALEGVDGNFFRIQPDLRMYFPLTDALVGDLARLSQALATQGTTLIYAPVPPKGSTMTAMLPAEAQLYGFDPEVAKAIYHDTVAQLRAAGITTVDLLDALENSDPNIQLFFKADFHWTADGAERASRAIADTIKADTGYADLKTAQYTTISTGSAPFVSAMRRLLQKSCLDSLPEAVTNTFRTTEIEEEGVAVDIFGDGGADTISLVGTSFSEVPQFNFGGFISQHTGLNVRNLAISGGNQFASIASYLTSVNFLEDRPRYLIWENPIYNNLAQFGEGPLDELIVAVEGNCDAVPASALETIAADEVRLDLNELDLSGVNMLMASAGSRESREIDLTYSDATGRVRTQNVIRPQRFKTSGRFYIFLGDYGAGGFSTLTIRFDRPAAHGAQISTCLSSPSESPSL